MEIKELLKGVDCTCGRHHSCDIDFIAIERGAIGHLTGLCANDKCILVVADENTYGAAGSQTMQALAGRNVKQVIFPGSVVLIPNEDAVAKVTENLEGVDKIIGIGSGVIQDLCKYVSHQSGIPYYVVATAPSMDGYTSTGAAMIMGGMKVTYSAGLPAVLVADPSILKDAPMDMIQAGYGDIVGKYSALNDWRLSQVVNGEYFCQDIYDMTMDMVHKTLALAEGLVNRDEESIKVLMEALIVVGIAMSFAGSSRPASGSEHHLSHFFEITGIVHNEPYFPHGIDVAYSTIVTAALRDELLAKDWPSTQYRPSRAEYCTTIKEIYGSVADGCIALQDKVGLYNKDMVSIYKAKEDEIRAVLAEMPKAAEIEEMLAAVGLDKAEFHKLYSDKKIADAVAYAKELKDRYTVLWLHYDLFGGKNRMKLSYKHPMTVAAHRGDSYCCYENTMEAFEAALATGAEMIETDVRMTKDGQLVLMHDDNCKRTAGDLRRIADMTWEEVQKLNVGSDIHPLSVPTLEELLQWTTLHDELMLNIELKEYHEPGNEERCKNCVDIVVAMVKKYGLADRIVLNSFDAWPLQYADEAYDHSFMLHGFYPYEGMRHVDRNPDEYLYCACIWGNVKIKEHYDHLLKVGIEPWVGASFTSTDMLDMACRYGAVLVTTNHPGDTIERLKGLGKRA